MGKRRLLVLVILAAALCLLLASAGAETKRSGLFRYEVTEEQTARITDYMEQTDSEPGILHIPASLDDYPVTEIGDSAFHHKLSLAGVVIPEGVRIIGNKTFSACDAIQSVELPSTLETLGENAFAEDIGESVEDDLADKIFSDFCMRK